MEWSKRLRPFAPMLSVVLVGSCIGVSLSGYEAPVYAVEEIARIEEQTGNEGNEESLVQGAFDLEDGVYQGTGTGYAGKITVAVQIKDKSIVSIEILSVEADDTAFFNRAKGVIDKIIAQQSLDVDVVSGATYSSKGIISAVRNALTGEKDSGKTAASDNQAVGTTSISAVEEAAAYKDGTYYGSGTGFAGTITVKVVISGGKIASVDITGTNDGSSYIRKASALIDRIISGQTTNVDTVSGATYSSVGIIQAVRNALNKAAVTASSSGSETVSGGTDKEDAGSGAAAVTGTIPYNDGIYYGTAEGYAGDVTVAVVIQEKTIKAILVTETEDDESFFHRAMAVVTDIIKNQSTDVDVVSGATYSSQGLIGAVKNALAEADRVTNGGDDNTADGDDNPDGGASDGDDSTSDSNDSTSDGGADTSGGGLGGDSGGDEGSDSPVYADGTYTAAAVCSPDEDNGFDPYHLTLTVTIENGRITAISNVSGDGDKGNNTYIRRAVSGRGSDVGVATQIINNGYLPEHIDAVSGATCSSDAVFEACKAALAQAAADN